MGHTTAAQDHACFTLPRRATSDVVARLKPVTDWLDNPDDPELLALFGDMGYRDFFALRQRVIAGKASFTASPTTASRSSASKEKEKERERKKKRKHPSREKEQDDEAGSSSRGKKRRRDLEYRDDYEDSEDLDN